MYSFYSTLDRALNSAVSVLLVVNQEKEVKDRYQ